MINELAFVAYYVRDVPRARQFYGEVLGLRPGQWFNDLWIEFDLGNATFALDGTAEELGITPGTSMGAAFEVDDVESVRQRIIDAGAEVSEIHEFPPCWACFARDPEGNRFVIHKRKA
ncbi:MAG TPA: VOC family protein [Candidatus Baltobacteraceae bacterium]|nr:VOC family protein [Candidatus Baltobacteraceae bacterium]